MYVYTIDIYLQIGQELISKECGDSFAMIWLLYRILPSVGQFTLCSVNDLHIYTLVRSEVDRSQLNRTQGRVRMKWICINALQRRSLCADFKSFRASWMVF
jgi:hypothetical protein